MKIFLKQVTVFMYILISTFRSVRESVYLHFHVQFACNSRLTRRHRSKIAAQVQDRDQMGHISAAMVIRASRSTLLASPSLPNSRTWWRQGKTVAVVEISKAVAERGGGSGAVKERVL